MEEHRLQQRAARSWRGSVYTELDAASRYSIPTCSSSQGATPHLCYSAQNKAVFSVPSAAVAPCAAFALAQPSWHLLPWWAAHTGSALTTWRGEPRAIQLWDGKLEVTLHKQSPWLLARAGCGSGRCRKGQQGRGCCAQPAGGTTKPYFL